MHNSVEENEIKQTTKKTPYGNQTIMSKLGIQRHRHKGTEKTV
jgi:hypothetical protein